VDKSWEVVLLARHGVTQWNMEGRRQGQLDSPLTVDGIEQVRRAAIAVTSQGVDGVFSSPLGRAAATARIFADYTGAPLVVIRELAEIHHGQFAGMTNEEISGRYPGALEERAQDKYRWRFPGGESYADADVRAASALAMVAAHPARRPLIVSHDMIGRLLQRRLLGMDVSDALAGQHPHDVVYVIDYRGQVPARHELRA
jgi:broad specificity phosphatase PhoE